MKLINIVAKVERTLATNLQGMSRVSEREVKIPRDIDWITLQIKPHAQLTITDRVENKNRVWTAKLVFKTCESYNNNEKWAYRCTLTNGLSRLIGESERPHPVTNMQENMPENVADSQLNEVTVTWQSPRFVPSIRKE